METRLVFSRADLRDLCMQSWSHMDNCCYELLQWTREAKTLLEKPLESPRCLPFVSHTSPWSCGSSDFKIARIQVRSLALGHGAGKRFHNFHNVVKVVEIFAGFSNHRCYYHIFHVDDPGSLQFSIVIFLHLVRFLVLIVPPPQKWKCAGFRLSRLSVRRSPVSRNSSVGVLCLSVLSDDICRFR